MKIGDREKHKIRAQRIKFAMRKIDDPHDARDLARAMAALTDGANRQSAAQTSREISKAWTFEHHYQQFIALLDDVRGLKRAA